MIFGACFFGLLFAVRLTAAVIIAPNDPHVNFDGRYIQDAQGNIQFDAPGFKIRLGVIGTSKVSIKLTANGNDQPNVFWVYINGKLSDYTIDTKNAPVNEMVEYALCTGLTPTQFNFITVVKVTEADYNNIVPTTNYVTFSGFDVDSGKAISLPAKMINYSRKIEFVGDSITAGYCNMCKLIANTGGGAYAQESFAKSWPHLVAETLQASRHISG
jgi:hypothetical protein